MPRNNAQQAAAQIAEARKVLSKQDNRKGLAESVRKDMVKDANRGKDHDTLRQMSSSTDSMLRALVCPPR